MLDKVKAPAIVLIVLGALGVLGSLASLALPNDPESMREAFESLGEQMDWGQDQIEAWTGTLGRFDVLMNLLGLAMALFVLFAGVQMLRGRMWGLAVAGSIVAMVPCWCCCLLGIPAGIWSLVVLNDKDVKSAFAAADTPPNPPPL
ncbi:MAG: hypothetical protein JNK02_10965 [Planctomycetes bacterium]|nr:hypothetical protein [Planctomycetota bacterium]